VDPKKECMDLPGLEDNSDGSLSSKSVSDDSDEDTQIV
jgi:hypothetical protein